MNQTLRATAGLVLIMSVMLLAGWGCSHDSSLDPVNGDSDLLAAKAAPVPSDPWALAELEQVTAGSGFDMLSRRAVGVDDMGTVHAIYQRGVGLELGLYYHSKPSGGEWSEAEVIGAPGTYPGTGWLEVCKETGEAYVAFHNERALMLGIRSAAGWAFHTLETPAEYGVAKPALSVDVAGVVHVAMLISWDLPSGFVMWQMAYGYWDGSSDFHFQIIEPSYVPHHGLFAQPDIVAYPDGSVSIAHHQLDGGQMLIMVDDNHQLGGTEWTFETVNVNNVIVYPESLELDQFGYLHVAFHTNIELGAEHKVYHAVRKDSRFGRAEKVSGDFTGARPRLAFDPDGNAHFVFEETTSALSTGRLIHAFKNRGKWEQAIVIDNEAFAPSFVMDSEGNGSLLFERKIIHMENNDIKYFGHAVPLE